MLDIYVGIGNTEVKFQTVEILISTSITWRIIESPRPAALRVQITNWPLSII